MTKRFTKAQQKAIAELSPRAKKTWDKIREGKFYKTYALGLPYTIDELCSAGLIEVQGRVETVIACWVPVGTKEFKFEEYPVD